MWSKVKGKRSYNRKRKFFWQCSMAQ